MLHVTHKKNEIKNNKLFVISINYGKRKQVKYYNILSRSHENNENNENYMFALLLNSLCLNCGCQFELTLR